MTKAAFDKIASGLQDAIDLAKPKKGRCGFASMAPEKQRAIASKGGLSVDRLNRSFSKDPELAREAGRKGGTNRAINAGQEIGKPKVSKRKRFDPKREPENPYIHNAE